MMGDQIPDQTVAFLVARGSLLGRLVRFGIPTHAVVAQAIVVLGSGVENLKKTLVPHVLARACGVSEQPFGEIHRWQGSLGVSPLHVFDIAA